MYAFEYFGGHCTDEHLEDVYNKVDAISLEEVDRLAHQPKTVVISCEMDLKYVVRLSYIQMILNWLQQPGLPHRSYMGRTWPCQSVHEETGCTPGPRRSYLSAERRYYRSTSTFAN